MDLVSLKDGFSLESPAGRLHARILASVAEYETEVRAERVAAGQAVARKKGKQWGGSEKGWRWKVSDDQVNAIHEMRRAQKPILALGILEQISRSEDEVSKALAPIFAKAVPHSQEELQRARERRELVNPPGKNTNPIGDQLTWEQILIRFQEKRRLWIISRDGDYGTVFDDKGFLNRFLYDELCNVASAPEADLFADTVEGIRHFVDTTGVKAEKRLRNRRRITSVFPNSQAAYNERMVLSALCGPKALQFAQPRATPWETRDRNGRASAQRAIRSSTWHRRLARWAEIRPYYLLIPRALPWAGRTRPLRGEAVEDLWKLFYGRS